MKFETKYSIGDIVFYLNDNSVKSAKIDIIEIRQFKNELISDPSSIGSYVKYVGIGNFTLHEAKVFKSKEELLKSL